MARKSKDVIAAAAAETAGLEEKKGKGKKPPPPSNVTEDTIRTSMTGIFEAHAEMAKAKEALDRANGIYRQKVKAAEQLGMDRKAILETVRLKKVEPGEHVSLLNKTIRYCAIMNMPVGTQLSMFLDATEKAEALPYNAGRLAAENSEPTDNNPYLPGSEEHQQWAQGHNDWLFEHVPKPAGMTNGAGASA